MKTDKSTQLIIIEKDKINKYQQCLSIISTNDKALKILIYAQRSSNKNNIQTQFKL